MGRSTGPTTKISRRFGVDLGLKTNAAKVAKRLGQAPGVHGATKKRPGSGSSFGKQLIEKQKAKAIYGLREKQFRRFVEEASRLEGDSGVNLVQLLETRMDNVVYRLGFAVTRAQARQLVGHNMFTLNGKKMNIASHIVRPGDVVALKANKAKKTFFENVTDKLNQHQAPSWVTVDAVAKTGKILHKPLELDVEKIFDVKLIIEFYSSR